MRINISDIVKIDGASLNVNFNEVMDSLQNLIGDEFVFGNPVIFEGKISNTSGVLKLEGNLKTEYTVKCYRCLKDINSKLDTTIKENLVDAEKVEKDTDIETYTYEGNFIEIDRILIDNIVLNLPMKQVCTKDCKGICPKCGVDLNLEQCECKEDEADPRMEILKNFFKS
jgi:uncharacterized protein